MGTQAQCIVATSVMGLVSRNAFREKVERATSPLLPTGHEDVALNFEICDLVRSKAVPPLRAMQEIKLRVTNTNPNVKLLALGVR